MNFYTTHVKFGIGRATYDAAQEIRSGDLTREEAVALVRRYDGEFPERFIDELFEYLSLPIRTFGHISDFFEQPMVTRDYFETLADSFRSPHLWTRTNDRWELRHKVWDSNQEGPSPELGWKKEYEKKWTLS